MDRFDIVASIFTGEYPQIPLHKQLVEEGGLVACDLPDADQYTYTIFTVTPTMDVYVALPRYDSWRLYKQTGGIGGFESLAQSPIDVDSVVQMQAAPNGNVYMTIGPTYDIYRRQIWCQVGGTGFFEPLPDPDNLDIGHSMCVTPDNVLYATGLVGVDTVDILRYNGSGYDRLYIPVDVNLYSLSCSPYTGDLYFTGINEYSMPQGYRIPVAGGVPEPIDAPSNFLAYNPPAFSSDGTVYYYGFNNDYSGGTFIKQVDGIGPFVEEAHPELPTPVFISGFKPFICLPNNDIYVSTEGGTYKQTGGVGQFIHQFGKVTELNYYLRALNPAHMGGLIGAVVTDIYSSVTVESSYWDVNTSGQPTSAGGVGKTTSDMEVQGTFLGWDFPSTWSIINGEIYPFLSYIVNFSSDVTSGAPPLTVNFTGSAIPIYTSWFWEFGDGGTSSLQNPSHTYNSTGYYTVTLTVDAPNGFKQRKIGYIHVISTTVFVEFSGTPRKGAAFLTVNFVDLSIGQFDSWFWDFGDGYTSTEQNPMHYYSHPGEYTISLTASGGSGTLTNTKARYIRVLGLATYDIAVEPDRKIYLWGNGMTRKVGVGVEIRRVTG